MKSLSKDLPNLPEDFQQTIETNQNNIISLLEQIQLGNTDVAEKINKELNNIRTEMLNIERNNMALSYERFTAVLKEIKQLKTLVFVSIATLVITGTTLAALYLI